MADHFLFLFLRVFGAVVVFCYLFYFNTLFCILLVLIITEQLVTFSCRITSLPCIIIEIKLILLNLDRLSAARIFFELEHFLPRLTATLLAVAILRKIARHVRA